MTRVELHASWMDGEAFRALWAPLDEAEEFFLISCYVSGPAWEQLEITLRAHLKRPAFRCTLVFSLAGIAAISSRELIDRLFLLVKDHPPDDRLRAFLVDDQRTALFHPKAHGSRAGRRTKVVVGSANLTTAAMYSNYELMTVVEDDPEAYQVLRRAVDALATASLVKVDQTTIDDLRNTTATRALAERATSAQRGDGIQPKVVLELPKRNYGLLLPPTLDYQEGWLSVRKLLGRGGWVARIDQLDPLVVSIPLTSFREAGLLATPKAQEVGTGVSYETGGGSITVSLIPNDLRKNLTQLTMPLGKLVGRFSIECLGGRWMPIDWDEPFRHRWEILANSQLLVEAERTVAAHVKRLERDLGRSGKLSKLLGEQLEVQKPAFWVETKVRRLLRWPADRSWPKKLTASLQDAVVEAVLNHVTSTVERRLSPGFVIAQLRQAGRAPLLRQVALETVTVVDALFLLSEWAMSGVAPRLRSAHGELSNAPGRSGVVQVLAEAFDESRTSAETVFEAALGWQNVALAQAVDEKVILRTLSEAWSNFILWYGVTPERIHWAQHIPAWSNRASNQDDTQAMYPRLTKSESARLGGR